VDWHDWLLFLHVGSVFVFGMALVAFWGAVIAGLRPAGGDPEALALTIARPANVLVAVGSIGSLAFGVWLAIDLDEYHPWDGWIVASLVLWAVAVGVGGLAARAFQSALGREAAEASVLRQRGTLFQTASTLAYVAILVLMIFKPGA